MKKLLILAVSLIVLMSFVSAIYNVSGAVPKDEPGNGGAAIKSMPEVGDDPTAGEMITDLSDYPGGIVEASGIYFASGIYWASGIYFEATSGNRMASGIYFEATSGNQKTLYPTTLGLKIIM